MNKTFRDQLTSILVVMLVFDLAALILANFLEVFFDQQSIIHTKVYSWVFWVNLIIFGLLCIIGYWVRKQRNGYVSLLNSLETKVQNNNPEDLHIRTFLAVAKLHVGDRELSNEGFYNLVLLMLLGVVSLIPGEFVKIIDITVNSIHFDIILDIRLFSLFVTGLLIYGMVQTIGQLNSNSRFFKDPMRTLLRYPDFRKWDEQKANESSKLHFGVELNDLYRLM